MPCLDELVKQIDPPSCDTTYILLLDEAVTIDNLASFQYQLFHFVQIRSCALFRLIRLK